MDSMSISKSKLPSGACICWLEILGITLTSTTSGRHQVDKSCMEIDQGGHILNTPTDTDQRGSGGSNLIQHACRRVNSPPRVSWHLGPRVLALPGKEGSNSPIVSLIGEIVPSNGTGIMHVWGHVEKGVKPGRQQKSRNKSKHLSCRSQ